MALSSADEQIAAKASGLQTASGYPGPVFEDQMTWVQAIIGRFLSAKRDRMPKFLKLIFVGLERYFFWLSVLLDILRSRAFEETNAKFD